MEKLATFIVFSLFVLSCRDTAGNKKSSQEDSLSLKYIEMKSIGLRFGYPSSWLLVSNNPDSDLIFSSKKQCPDSLKFCPNITITKVLTNGSLPLDSYVHQYWNYVHKRYTESSVISAKETQIGNLMGVILDYRFITEGIDIGATVAFLPVGNFILVVNCMAINSPPGAYVNSGTIFEKVIQSFRLI